MSEPWRTDPPGPDGARSIAELATRLRALQVWAGLSVREIHRRVVQQRRSRGVPELPALDTVHRCFRPDRVRLDQELVVDIARAVLGDDLRAAEWRQVHRLASRQTAAGTPVAVRRGLPEPCHGFVGRRAELEFLLAAPAEGTVVVLHGMAGVGKTTLASHAARQLVGHGYFTDLQLSVSLHGSDLEYPPADPGVVLDGMLGQLGCSAHELCYLDLPGRMALLQRRLAGKRALILLDDAATAGQVAPLLPDAQACLTLITSRRQLTGLAARHIPVEPFTPGESHELLAGIVGTARLADETAAAAGIAEVVGHLPLAIALLAGKIRKTPDWTLQDHLARLLERRAHLTLDKDVMLALESSYLALPAPRQRLLRLLGIHPSRSVDSYATAALANLEPGAAAADLAALASESLLVQEADGRFEMHDLVRLFAADRASDVDPPRARAAALTRLFEYYRFVAYQAARRHEPHNVLTMSLPRPTTAVPVLADRPAAVGWLAAELPNLIACAMHSADHDQPEYISDLASMLLPYLSTIGRLQDAERLNRRASQVTRGIDKARALGRLGSACSWLGRLDEARRHYQRALAVFMVDGDSGHQARCLGNYGILCQRLGRFDQAIRCHREANALFLACDERSLAAREQSKLGWLYVMTSQPARGVRSLQQALAIARETADQVGEAYAVGNLGVAALIAGRPQEALDRHDQTLRIHTELGDRAGYSIAHCGRGAALAALGELAAAMEQYRLALASATETGEREDEAEALIGGGWVRYLRSRFEDALDWHVGALRVTEMTGNIWQQARAHDGIACTRDAIGDPETARAHRRRASALNVRTRVINADRIVVTLANARRTTLPVPASTP